MINADFYDIESLRNLFTLANMHDAEDPKQVKIDLYYLCDDEDKLFSEPNWQDRMRTTIYDKNRNFNGTIVFRNLRDKESIRHLCKTFGVSNARFMNNPSAKSDYPKSFRLVCDTDPEYDPAIHPYLCGYNSYNYDTTMLAWYMQAVLSPQIADDETKPGPRLYTRIDPDAITASGMREFNNKLFEPSFKSSMPSALAMDASGHTDYSTNAWRIRKNMLMSGRHLDVARLNEKQVKVGLKRLLGMLGYQILESDKLDTGADTIETIEQLYELIAYNISDVVNLRMLFYHQLYQGQFELKKGLLTTYPELIYTQKPGSYEPNIGPANVRPDRLTIDSSSAQFSTKALCPYNHLKDIPCVSFDYPAEEQAREMGVPRVNVLEEARKFFYRLYPQQHLRDQFDVIYNYYKSVEGKNFNDSQTYADDYTQFDSQGNLLPIMPVHKLSEIPKTNTCLPYFDKDGNPTSCFVLFSTGGVHGAEYNVALYEYDMQQYREAKADMEEAQRQFPNPVDLRKAKTITMPDGRVLDYKTFLRSGFKIADSQYKDLSKNIPQLFKADTKGNYSLNKKYVFTSTCQANHEDFTSYYPNLLRRMMAFFNTGLGYDRYAEIFQQKQDFGKYMKDKSRPEEERSHYRILREGTKLILNSASGAADAAFENNIRVNNQIISMRIIGQLFSWRIGQAQSYEGAAIPSTNTDGLYSVMEEKLNNAILERESASIGVEIEPEPLYLISKDSNNRIEFDASTGNIISASGGTTGCRKGPNPTKSLAHPAIIDWALTEYLIVTSQNYKGLRMDGPFNPDIGRNILQSAIKKFAPVQLLIMYQNILASSASSITYIYGMVDGETEPKILQNYNRIFIMKDGFPGTMHLQSACARVVTPAMKRKRKAEGNRITAAPDPIALKVLIANGEPLQHSYYPDKDIVTKKVTNIEPSWNILVLNQDLHLLPQSEIDHIVANLDMDKYLKLLDDAYTRNWMNKVPGVEYADLDDNEDEDGSTDE